MLDIEQIINDYPKSIEIKQEIKTEREKTRTERLNFFDIETKKYSKKVQIRTLGLWEKQLEKPIVIERIKEGWKSDIVGLFYATPKSQLAKIKGEFWVNVSDSFRILDSQGTIDTHVPDLLSLMFGLKKRDYTWTEPDFLKTIASESGKILSVLIKEGKLFPLSLFNSVENIQTLYPPLTTTLKDNGYSILSLVGTERELDTFVRAGSVDPKIEVLLE